MQDESLDETAFHTDKDKDEYIPPYGDVTKLNHCRLIMDSVGAETLKEIGQNAIKLLDTSVAIYEANGDYAFGMFSSKWCRFMDFASRELCKTNDNLKALSCGKWLCHENCWNDLAKRAIETGKSTDIKCVGGIHLYAEPIYAGKSIIGSINIGYGDPPKDPAQLKTLAAKFGVDPEKLKEISENYKSRPQFIVDATKNLLGTFAKLIGNIVEKAEAEKNLAESQKWLIQAQKIAHTGSWKLDLTSYRLSWSDETFRIFGCRPQEFSPNFKVFLEFVHPDDRAMVKEVFAKSLREKSEGYDIEHRIIPQNSNEVRHVHERCIHVRDNKGAIIQSIGMAQDITERKHTESCREMGREILQILNEPGELQESIQRVLAVLKTRTGFDAVGMRLQEGDDFPYYVQDGFSRDFLLTENTLIERGEDGGVCRDEDGNIRLECTCGLVISGKTDPSDPLFTKGGSSWTNDSFPFLDVPSDQDPRLHPRNNCIHQGYASVALIPIRTSDRIVGLIQLNDKRKDRFTLEMIEILEGIAGHIGSALMRKRAEEEKEKATHEAKVQQLHKFESLGRMAAAIAHHFNNQLSVVLGNLELVLMDLPKDAQNRKKIVQAFKAGRKAADKSTQMLRYLGHISGSQKNINLSAVCRRSLALLKSTLPNGVNLNVNFPDYGPFINADAIQIQQVLTDLLTNALESLPENQGTIGLIIQTVSHADISTSNRFPLDWQPQNIPYTCLEVSDTGCGIAREDIENIFDPFYTTKFIGRGMGLPETMGILKTHGGCITVDPELDSGCAFKVYFPATTKKETKNSI